MPHFIVEKRNRGEHCKKHYGDTLAGMVKTATRQLFRNVIKFVKHRYGKEVTVEGDELRSTEWRDIVKEISSSATNSRTLPSAKSVLSQLK